MTAMELVISEIVMRATAKVLGPGTHPQRVSAVADPLAEAIVDMVVAQGGIKPAPVVLNTYLVWEMWNRILDEIEKEIPIAADIEVIVSLATRSQRRVVTSETWRSTVSKPIHKQE